MTWALAAGIQALRAYNDSQVVVSQVNNEFTVHSENLKAYGERATSLKTKFWYFELSKISLSENEVTDKLAKITSSETPNDDGIVVEFYSQIPSIQPLRRAEPEEKSWIDEINEYISHDVLPLDNIVRDKFKDEKHDVR